MLDLPDEIVLKILQYPALSSVIHSLSSTCKRIFQLSHTAVLWKRFTLHDTGRPPRSTRGIVLKAYLRGTVNIFSIYISTASSKKIFFLWFTNRNVTRTFSLRSKCFQSSYSTRVRAGAKKKLEGGGGGEKRKRLPASPTILENAPRYFTVRFICKLTARQDR